MDEFVKRQDLLAFKFAQIREQDEAALAYVRQQQEELGEMLVVFAVPLNHGVMQSLIESPAEVRNQLAGRHLSFCKQRELSSNPKFDLFRRSLYLHVANVSMRKLSI